jgi:ribosomal protein S18 acetylase RimI-like enzyme
MSIRDFQLADTDDVVRILRANGQYSFPPVDRPEAMKRVMECSTCVFLVCEFDGKVVGVARGNYDGSRAMIHQVSVHPEYQRRGIGESLVKEVVKRFQEMGARTVSATVIEESLPFWQKIGFKKTSIFLVGNW